MRYTNLKAFEKQLVSQGSGQSSHLYLVSSSDDFDRKQALDAILSHVLAPDGFVTHFNGNEVTVSGILDAINSPALFGAESVVVVDEVDKKLIDNLSLHLKKPLAFGYLLLGSKIKISQQFIDASALVLDLLEERPWEKEKRWTETLHQKAQAAGKRLSPNAAGWMIEHLEKDAAILSSEMDKLLCFTAHKAAIELSDVEEVCSASRTSTLWQIADELIWCHVFRSNAVDMRDSSFFHGLLSNLRLQLLCGLKMHELSSRQVPFSEWSSHFPKIWPKTLEKKAQIAQKLGPNYFRDGLTHLFEIELLAKNSAVPLDALLDFFRVRFS